MDFKREAFHKTHYLQVSDNLFSLFDLTIPCTCTGFHIATSAIKSYATCVKLTAQSTNCKPWGFFWSHRKRKQSNLRSTAGLPNQVSWFSWMFLWHVHTFCPCLTFNLHAAFSPLLIWSSSSSRKKVIHLKASPDKLMSPQCCHTQQILLDTDKSLAVPGTQLLGTHSLAQKRVSYLPCLRWHEFFHLSVKQKRYFRAGNQKTKQNYNERHNGIWECTSKYLEEL